MIQLLELYKALTQQLLGAKYLTLNLVHPCIYMLKQMFAPKNEQNKTIDGYMDLIYSPLIQDDILESAEDNDDSNSTSDNNDQDSAIGKNVEEHAANLNNVNTEDIFAKI
ncbi:25351_t:CDS:2 [Dentiscutata erythropus]|uniref:25351_t:CDS:1 n=1 Tax=Dentiscutata erythropus TaxID=1348616 RepID=A0A9N9AEH4_9GLOM|nr:25351_t:CDS:2 [Dentiscutata erythropus]